MFGRFVIALIASLILFLPRPLLSQYTWKYVSKQRKRIIPVYTSRVVLIKAQKISQVNVVVNNYPSRYRMTKISPTEVVRYSPERNSKNNSGSQVRTSLDSNPSLNSYSKRLDRMEREIGEIKREVRELSEKVEKHLLMKEKYREYKEDLEKMERLKHELLELRSLLKDLRSRY